MHAAESVCFGAVDELRSVKDGPFRIAFARTVEVNARRAIDVAEVGRREVPLRRFVGHRNFTSS